MLSVTRIIKFALVTLCALACANSSAQAFPPGSRTLLDAHNCYPYQGRWADRIERALSTGMPLAMEPDLDWVDGRSIVSHGKPYTGGEPTLEEYFLSRVAPALREAAKKGPREDWPLVVLNVDFKDSSAEHCRAIWKVLEIYEDILTTAVKTDDIGEVSPLDVRPLLVLASGAGGQYQVFYEEVPAGGKLLVFGGAETTLEVPNGLTGVERADYIVSIPPERIVTSPADNFRRWWNNSWHMVEAGGAPRAGEWTEADDARLRALVAHAHGLGYWIRFYTLNGHEPVDSQGWDRSYNMGSRGSVEKRWRAAIAAGVDFVATDMYEAFSTVLREAAETRRVGK